MKFLIFLNIINIYIISSNYAKFNYTNIRYIFTQKKLLISEYIIKNKLY
jgi:hypothetical protein